MQQTMLSQKYRDLLNKKFDVIDNVNFKQFDMDFDVLHKMFSSIKHQTFTAKQKFIVEHFDLDYYDSKQLVHGLNLHNFFRVAHNHNLPMSIFVFVTNYFGLQNEIDSILEQHDKMDRPIVIETFLIKNHYNAQNNNECDINLNKIEYPAICMCGASRSHRNALYTYFVNNNMLDTVSMSIKK